MTFERLYLTFAIDSNVINARRSLPAMNQLERWEEAGLIGIHMLQPSHEEAKQGHSAPRVRKVHSRLFALRFSPTRAELEEMSAIERVLFPNGARSESQRTDVDIVFQAKRYDYPLITLDGRSSRQPGGMLGNRDKLAEMGVTVLTPDEAVAMARRKAMALGVRLDA